MTRDEEVNKCKERIEQLEREKKELEWNTIELNGRKFNSILDMCKYITQLERKVRRYEEMLGSAFAAAESIIGNKERFMKLKEEE